MRAETESIQGEDETLKLDPGQVRTARMGQLLRAPDDGGRGHKERRDPRGERTASRMDLIRRSSGAGRLRVRNTAHYYLALTKRSTSSCQRGSIQDAETAGRIRVRFGVKVLASRQRESIRMEWTRAVIIDRYTTMDPRSRESGGLRSIG